MPKELLNWLILDLDEPLVYQSKVLVGSARPSCPVDVWSIVCIFVEISNKKPLFKGDFEIDRLF